MDEFLDYNICNECLDEEFLVAKIETEGTLSKCHYCKKRNKTIKMSELIDLIDEMHRSYMVEREMSGDIEIDEGESIGYDPVTLVTVHTGLEYEIAEQIVNHLSQEERHKVVKDGASPMYDDTLKYDYRYVDDLMYPRFWNAFCYILKHESRFFSKPAIGLLDELFNKLDSLYSTIGVEPIRSYGSVDKEKYFYRARKVFEEQKRIDICLNPEKELGPPNIINSKLGRMNPAGISVLYGCLLRDTCVDELRLSAGEIVVSAKFELTKPIQILDLTVFNKMHDNLSLFDPEYVDKLSYLNFIQKFGSEISEPINPNTKEIDYLPTQAFAEYLNDHFEPKIDAVIYNSVQNISNKNIVFLKNIVKDFDEHKYKKINSKLYNENFGESYYALFEKQENQIESEFIDNGKKSTKKTDDYVVNFVENSLKIHVAEKVTTECKTYPVKKYF